MEYRTGMKEMQGESSTLTVDLVHHTKGVGRANPSGVYILPPLNVAFW